ncbi:MAG: protein kinase domain-containing protein [Bryobacteraceae bacterium]
MIGESLGRFKIFDKFGENYCAIFYKAKDTRDDRLVLLAILKAEAGADPERRRRLEEDARAASALNHQNISQVLEFASENGIGFLVYDCPMGESLDSALKRKRLRRRETIAYSIQFATALSAAHDAGLIHGSLSPSCLLVIAKRRVKVLGFGLRHLMGKPEESPNPECAAFFAPEQVAGKEPDPLSDVFAFGSIVYQMAGRHFPFLKDSVMATLYSIQHDEPPSVSELSRRYPRGIEKVLSHTLQKDPARRFQHIGMALPILRKLKEELESGAMPRGSFLRDNRERIMRAALIGGVAAAIGAAGYFYFTREPGEPTVRTDVTALTTPVTTGPSLDTHPAITPKGDWVAYASDRAGEGNLDIWAQTVNSKNPQRLTNDPADDFEPAFSPDGSRLAFRSERAGGGIYVMPAKGGDAKLIAPGGRRPRFSPDSRTIAYYTGPPGTFPPSDGDYRLYIVDVDGGAPRRLALDFSAASFPIWAPDNEHLLFIGVTQSTELPEWWLTSLQPKRPINLGACQTFRRFSLFPEGRCAVPGDWVGGFVTFAAPSNDAAHIYRVPLSVKSPAIALQPARMTSGNDLELHPYLSGDNRVVFSRQTLSADIWSLPISANEGKATGQWKRLTRHKAFDLFPTLSRDGKKMLFQSNRSGQYTPWLMTLDDGKERQLTRARQDQWWPRISADGSRFVYTEQRIGAYEHFLSRMDGAREEVLCQDCGPFIHDWSPDGNRILIDYVPRDWPFVGIGLIELPGLLRIPVLADPKHHLTQARFSPDMKWVLFAKQTSASVTRLTIAPFHGAKLVPQSEWIAISDDRSWDTAPAWSPDGKLVYFTSSRDGYRCIWAQRLGPGNKPSGDPFAVHHFHSSRWSPSLLTYNALDMFVGRDRILLTIGEAAGNIWIGRVGN